MYNPLKVEPKSLLESLGIRVFHSRVVAIHVVSREATFLAAHLRKFISSIFMKMSKGKMSVPGPCNFEEDGSNLRGIGLREALVLTDQDWQGRGLLWWSS